MSQLTAVRNKKMPRILSTLPEECWLRVFMYLEASELAGSAAGLCAGASALCDQPHLWLELLYGDFCATFTQRALLRAWVSMHQHFHPRHLYVCKRREHRLDLDMARTELLLRGEQAREQERKQRRMRILNFIFVRVTHLLLCMSLLTSSVFYWLKVLEVVKWNYYIVLLPVFVFEGFLLLSSVFAFLLYSLRGSNGWTFYWNRLRGAIRWLIMCTSACEGALVLALACTATPLMACALEEDLLLPKPYPRFVLPFALFWCSLLLFTVSLLRKRSVSASCVGSFALLWLPVVSVSILLFLRLSYFHELPAYAVFAPSLAATGLLLVFVTFLVIASFWLGYRGNRDWIEYAAITLLTLVTLLLPLLLIQLAVLGYLSGDLSINYVLMPWVLWLSGMLACSMWHICSPLSAAPSVPPLDRLTRPWRAQLGQQPDHDSVQSDAELLLPPLVATA
eukprot:TRINITY_DN25982_c0_g1_i1.p1 TRINITY_DN25982_c0_g1~~TRINITY_DN25982_c0_g1_i1.p1  ORF type:complete len:451 (+),score=75.91 TRINITY_DN25982_c0_g1_i1:173-1525(+)